MKSLSIMFVETLQVINLCLSLMSVGTLLFIKLSLSIMSVETFQGYKFVFKFDVCGNAQLYIF